MTLHTTIYAHDPVNAQAVFARGRTLIGATAYGNIATDPYDTTVQVYRVAGEAASVEVGERVGAMITTPEQAARHDLCDRGCDGSHHEPASWVQITFETRYDYRGPGRAGCGDLHAHLVGELGRWLDSHGIRWSWLDETTGRVHYRYARLDELGDANRVAGVPAA